MLIAFGPRPRVPAGPTRPVEVPSDGASWLLAREARVPRLRPGQGSQVVWVDPQRRERTREVYLYLPGFSAAPLELSPVVENLAARRHANALLMRLTGHGQDGAALAEATVGDWFADAEEALLVAKQLGERVVLVGMSTGATLGLWLADRHPELAGLVLLSPNLGLADRRAKILLWPFGSSLAQLLAGATRDWTPKNELEAQRWTNHYPIRALAPVVALIHHVVSLDLARLRMPTLMVYSERDERLDTAAMLAGFERIGAPGKKRVHFEQAPGHVLAGDATAPECNAPLVEIIDGFLRTAPGL